MRDKREGVIVTWENGRDLLSNLPIRYHSELQFEFQHSFVCLSGGSGFLAVFILSKSHLYAKKSNGRPKRRHHRNLGKWERFTRSIIIYYNIHVD